MEAEVWTLRGRGRPLALLWLLLLLPLAALGLRGSPSAATPASASGDTVEGGVPTPTVQRLAPGSLVCGRPKVMGKIYGGQDVVAGQWPWQASLMYQKSHICGAALIDSFWLVSTAHCFINRSHAPENYEILLGSTQLYQHTQHAQMMSVNRIIMHPDFEKFHPFGNDIVMLQLHLPVNFTSYISPACLPTPGMQLPIYSSCWITGWGMLNEDTPLPPPFRLQEGKVSLVENQLCNMLYEQRLSKDKNYSVYEEMLCAGNFLTGKAICQPFTLGSDRGEWYTLESPEDSGGDSGSPLVCDLFNTWVLVGLASWGVDCRHPIYPSVFTNVTYFTDWISKIQRLTPPPEPTDVPPQTPFPNGLLRAAGSPGPHAALMPPRTWLPLLSVLRARQQALQ